MRRFARTCLGSWYVPGDFNPAPAVPVWPFLEWVLFFFTGVTVEAARGLAVALFFANLVLSYLLLRPRGPRWMALLALTLMVTSPFLYCFSRLAILEPLLTTLLLLALNLAVRLPRMKRPVATSAVDRRAVHADDADQDDGSLSGAGDWVGNVRGVLGSRRCIVGYDPVEPRTLVPPMRIALRCGRRRGFRSDPSAHGWHWWWRLGTSAISNICCSSTSM